MIVAPMPLAGHRLDDLDVLGLHHDARRHLLADEELVDHPARVAARLVQDERQLVQIGGLDLLLLRQRVPGVGHQQQVLAHHRLRDEVRLGHRQRQQTQVHRARAQPPHETVGRPGHHLDVHVRVQALELLQQRREDVDRDGHPADQPDRAAQLLLRLAQPLGGLADVVEDPDRQLEQRLAGRRDLDLALDAPEQRLVELGLEQQNLARNRRLRDVKAAAGPGKRPGLGHRLENFELSQIHKAMTRLPALVISVAGVGAAVVKEFCMKLASWPPADRPGPAPASRSAARRPATPAAAAGPASAFTTRENAVGSAP